MKLVGSQILRMPNCNIEAEQKVVSLYHKEYTVVILIDATTLMHK